MLFHEKSKKDVANGASYKDEVLDKNGNLHAGLGLVKINSQV